MKQKFLLVSAAMLLAGTAFAGEWVKPTVTGGEPVVDGVTEQYLYNTGAGAFFLGANDWNTRASVSTSKGYKVILTSTTETTGVDGTVSITDYVETQNAWKKTFVDGTAGIWVDNNAGANCDTWTLEQHDGYFLIGNVAFEGQTLGVAELYNGAAGDTRLYMSGDAGVSAEGAFHNQWVSVSAEVYEVYAVAMPTYEAAMALKAAIDDALAQFPNLDLAAELAVYNNTESTLEQLKAAKASVETKLAQAIADAAANSATVDNPSDLSDLIVNSTFDVIGDFTGWSSGFGAGGATSTCAECYNKSFDVYQEIKNLPNGVYTLTVDGFHRMGSAANSLAEFKRGNPSDAYVYATSAGETLEGEIMNNFNGIEPNDNSLGGMEVKDGDVSYFVPNSMVDAVTFFEAGKYNGNNVTFAVTDGIVKIGVKKSAHRDTDWVIVDNFKLTYFGGAADAYQMWLDKFIVALPTFDNVQYVTASVLEAYTEVVANHNTAANHDEVVANIAAINAAKADVEANVAAWLLLDETINHALETITTANIEGDDKDMLVDYLEFDARDMFDALELTTEEILAEVAHIQEMLNNAIQNGLQVGADFTHQLKNPDFSTGDWSGWQHEAQSGGNVAVSATAKCAEAWNNAGFDIYQVVEGAPTGVYEISLQGFYREGRGDAAWNLYFDEVGDPRETKPVPTASVYLNDAKSTIANVFDVQIPIGELFTTGRDNDPYEDTLGEFWYANNMDNAGEAFDAGYYTVSAFGLVADGAPMRIGIKGRSNNLGDSWIIFDNFKLTYQGFKPEIIEPILVEQMANLNTSGLYGADVKEAAEAALVLAQQAIATGDGKEMFNALNQAYKVVNAIEESKELFVALTNAINEFANAISESEASEEVKAEALAYYMSVSAGYPNFTNAQAEEALAKIAELTTSLSIPAAAGEASDEHPVDLTSVLVSPSFEKDGANTVEGWTYTSMPGGITSGQTAALAAEYYQATYDIYQDVAGLPDGTYRVGVNAFYRNGSTEEDFQSVADGVEGLAKMYAVTTENTYEKSVCLLAGGAQAEPFGIDGEISHTNADETVVYIPNNMVSAVAYFEAGVYMNELFVKVTDGKLRIGMKQDESITYGWMIMDNWTLTYYGANSQHPLSGIDAIANSASASNVEFFNLNGQKISGLQQGVCIVCTTLSNGEVVVRKVTVK